MYLHSPKFYFGQNFKPRPDTIVNLIVMLSKLQDNKPYFASDASGWFAEAYSIPHIFAWRLKELIESNYNVTDFSNREFTTTFLEWYKGVCIKVSEQIIIADIIFQEETTLPLELLRNEWVYKYSENGSQEKGAAINTEPIKSAI